MLRFNTSQFQFDRQHLFLDVKNDCIAAVGEFLGTIIFLLLGLGGISAAATSNAAASARLSQSGSDSVNTVASIEQLTYIAASMGLSLLFSAWVFYRVTGAAFNPNISFALLLIGVIKPLRFVLYCIAQFIGAIIASALLEGLLPGKLLVTPALGAGVNNAQGVFIEMFGTTALILSVMFLAVEKHKSSFLAPVGIGLCLFAVHLFAVVYTGAAVNTARAFGPSVISGFPPEHWIYWVGPTLGALLATVVYAGLKAARYWHLNPGQEASSPQKSPTLFITESHIDNNNEPAASDLSASSAEKAAAPGIEQRLGQGQNDRHPSGSNMV